MRIVFAIGGLLLGVWLVTTGAQRVFFVVTLSPSIGVLTLSALDMENL